MLQQQQNPDGSWEWAIPDGLGSVRGMIDAAGQPLQSQQFSPFGEPFNLTGTNQTPFGFTGEFTDSNGLLDLRARHYNPVLGVFPNPDPFEGALDDPMSLNRYSYVHNNPVNLVDPSGLCGMRKLGERATVPEIIDCYNEVSWLNNMGLSLQARPGVVWSDVWTTTRVQEVVRAVLAIQDAYTRNNAGASFTDVFHGTTFTITGQVNSFGCGQRTGTAVTPYNTDWYTCAGYDDPYSKENIIHELGHILIQHIADQGRYSLPQIWEQLEIKSNLLITACDGYPSCNTYRQDKRKTGEAGLPEDVADMFLYWVLGISFDQSPAGQIRTDFAEGIQPTFAFPDPFKKELLGFKGWSQLVAGQNSATPSAYDPTTLVRYLNGGLCDLSGPSASSV